MGLGIQNHNGIDVSLVSGVVIDQSRVDQLLAPLDFALTDENPKVPWDIIILWQANSPFSRSRVVITACRICMITFTENMIISCAMMFALKNT